MWFIKDTFGRLIVDLNKKKSGDFFTMVAHVISALFSILCLIAGFVLSPYILVLYLNIYKMYSLGFLCFIILVNYLLLKNLYYKYYNNPTVSHANASKVRNITSYLILISLMLHNGFFQNSLLGGYQQLFIFDNAWLNFLVIYLAITLAYYVAIFLAFYISYINIIIQNSKIRSKQKESN